MTDGQIIGDIAASGSRSMQGRAFALGPFGPSYIREHSRQLHPVPRHPRHFPVPDQQVVDAGDFGVTPYDIDHAVQTIHARGAAPGAGGHQALALGGDHTIALPLLRATAERHGPLAVLHFHTHLDTWDVVHGAIVWHGSPFRRAAEEGLLDLDHCEHVGIRGGIHDLGELEDDRRAGFQIIRTEEFQDRSVRDIADQILGRLGTGQVYVSVDINVFDPAHAPCTGTPQVAGITTRDLFRSWLNIAEIELSCLTKQCPGRRIDNLDTLNQELAAWQAATDTDQRQVAWRFTTRDARIKLRHLYPEL